MAPRQRHLTQPSHQDDISPSLVVVGASGAPVTVHIDDDDDNDTMNHDSDKHSSKPLLIVGTKHGASLVETTTTTTTPIYPIDEPSYNTNTSELSRDRHDIFNIVALVSLSVIWCCEARYIILSRIELRTSNETTIIICISTGTAVQEHDNTLFININDAFYFF
jgi:hypothetical protein